MSLDKKTQHIKVVRGVMKDLDVMAERLRHGTATPRNTWTALEEMYEVLQDLTLELRLDLPEEES